MTLNSAAPMVLLWRDMQQIVNLFSKEIIEAGFLTNSGLENV
jgi:hypothetical protein